MSRNGFYSGRRLALYVLLFCLLPVSVNAQQPILVLDGNGRQSLTRYSSYYLDETAELDFEDARSPSMLKQFLPVNNNRMNYGYTNAAIWFTALISNHNEGERRGYIEIKSARLQELEFWLVRHDGNIEYHSLGINHPVRAQDHKSRYPVIKIGLEPQETVRIFMRAQSVTTIHMEAVIWRATALFNDNAFQAGALGVFYGVIAILLLVNLTSFLIIRDLNYLYFLGHLLSVMIYGLTFDGLGRLYLWPDSPHFNLYISPISGVLAMLFAMAFCIRLLELKKVAPRLDRALRALVMLMLISLGLVVFSDLSFGIQLATLVGMTSPLIILGVSAYTWVQYPSLSSRDFLLAWGLLMICVSIWCMGLFGLLPGLPIVLNAVRIGVLLEALLLSQSVVSKLLEHREEWSRNLTQRAELLERYGEEHSASVRFVPRHGLALIEKKDIEAAQSGDFILSPMGVLFSDLRGFTARSEGMSSANAFRMLNAWYERCLPKIRAQEGFVCRYIGDAILCLFPGGSDKALYAARGMVEELGEYNAMLAEMGEPPIQLGIGVHFGQVCLGVVGMPDRMELSALGPEIEVAEKVEGLTKLHGRFVLVTDAALTALPDKEAFPLLEVGKCILNDSSQSTTLFTFTPNSSSERQEWQPG